MTPVYIVDVIRDVVAATSAVLLAQLQTVDPLITKIWFEYGHRNDINERLITYQNGGTNFCPMVCMFEDYRLKHGEKGLTGITNLVIVIIYYTKESTTRVEREANVFRPVLYPVYLEFLKQLKLNGKFSIYDETLIKHDQINRPNWGDPDLYKERPLKGVFDGIELNNLQLTTFLNNCL